VGNITIDKFNNKWFTAYYSNFGPFGSLFVYNEDGLQGVNGVDDEKDLHAFEMNAFPNPATDFIEISGVVGEVKEPVVKIYDVLGNVVVLLGDSRFRGNDIIVSDEGLLLCHL